MSWITIAIIAITCLISFNGFNNANFFDRYKFNIYAISEYKQIDRLLTSGFLHADFWHLFFNMFTLFFFARVVILFLGNVPFILVYILAILGGNLLTLWMYRRDMPYSAIGASGGVSGIVFAAVALYPQMTLMMMPIPIPIPGWLFAIGYLAYSIYGMKSALGNIGHTAHLGGAVIGYVSAIVAYPSIIQANGYYLALIAIPILVLAYFVYKGR
jgi:membrane associated rhomboid family serine protease